jgi:hypothetical protein
MRLICHVLRGSARAGSVPALIKALDQVPEIRALGVAGHRDTGHMPFRAPPSTASWQHREARSGFEVAYFQAAESGWIIEGTTAAVEDGQTWVVTYSIELDAAWVTRRARIEGRTVSGSRETRLESDGYGAGSSMAPLLQISMAAWMSTWNLRP